MGGRGCGGRAGTSQVAQAKYKHAVFKHYTWDLTGSAAVIPTPLSVAHVFSGMCSTAKVTGQHQKLAEWTNVT